MTDRTFLRFAETLADEAAALGSKWFRKPIDIATKEDLSPVTEADREIEALMRRRIAEAFPDHGIFGEEHGQERLDAEYVWVVDPIDGTRSFVTGWPIWGTLISLTHRGRPELGVIEMPVLGERWIANSGQPGEFVTRTGRREICRTSRCRALADARFYTTSPLYFDDREREVVTRIMQSAATPRFGGDCYAYGLLASGYIDLVVESRLMPFDYMALIPIIEAANGVVSDWAGEPLTFGSTGQVVAAATPQLHEEAIAVLRR
ncbi:histidinol-phosphatase [Pararhizobium mangrovi]